MMVFPIWIEHALNVAVQGSHDAEACEHRRASRRRDQDQGLHRGLPFLGLVLGLWKLGYVITGVLERERLATSRQRNRIIKPSFPAAISH
jgi:hypothetical protein